MIGYIIEVIICSGLFLVAYRWLLAKKVSFGLCRAFIITSMLLAAAIPAMNVPLFPAETFEQQTVLTGFDFFEEELEGVANAQSSEGTKVSEMKTAESLPARGHTDIRAAAGVAASIIYVIVALASLGLTVYNIIKIQRLRKRSKLTFTEEYTLAEHVDIKTPFSFLLTIFMGFNYEPHERRQILTHEASHVRHRHSFERISLSVLRSVFWFNPFFWMAEKDLEEVQEWEADKDVLSEGYGLDTYRTTIFKQLFGYNPDISCGLNHSLTKQRFIMMTQSHRGKGAWIRLAATLPVIAAVFLAFGCGAKSEAKAVETAENLTLDEQQPLTFRIHVAKSKEEKGTYSIYCNDILTDIETISKTVSEYFAGDDMFNTTVSISADENVPMGVITDIKEQLRNARALKVRYETHESTIEKRLPPAPKSETYPATVDVLAGTNRRNIIVMRVNSNGEMFLGSTYVKGSLHNDDLYAKELARLKELISNPEDKAECPEMEMRDIQMPDGSTRQFRVSKGMITFQNDRATSYEDYTKAMKLITTAYKELREEVSAEVFGKPLAELSDEQMQVIYRAVPMNVSEVEPKDVPARR
ncbi:MAG: hypothetical protein IJ005_02055 [Bacteroidales bacterium]|nr:hypothetical protein [Bacteroidales bacterium]